MLDLSQKLSSGGAFNDAVKEALASNRSPEVCKSLVPDAAASAQLYRYAEEIDVAVDNLPDKCRMSRADFALCAAGSVKFDPFAVQKILESISGKIWGQPWRPNEALEHNK